MEDIPDIYEMPYNPTVSVVRMDENLCQLFGEAREPLPMRPGDTRNVDSEYVRNGTTHALSSLYRAFPAPEARRIAKKPEIHYTPKHGSWLDIAEIKRNVMTRQCLSRRIEDMDLFCQELAAWERERNEHTACIQWQFTTGKARTKLVSLYPKFSPIEGN